MKTYKQSLIKAIDSAIVAIAITVAVTSYAISALQAWWDENSDSAVEFFAKVKNAAEVTRELGADFRRFVDGLNLNQKVAWVADRAFYSLVD